MADTSRDIAAKSVASACATTAGDVVKIITLNPLDVSPAGLFELTFADISLISDAQLEAFRATLITLLPKALQGDLRSMALSTGTVIGLVVDLVEDLLQALP
jgi:hypothetical protein